MDVDVLLKVAVEGGWAGIQEEFDGVAEALLYAMRHYSENVRVRIVVTVDGEQCGGEVEEAEITALRSLLRSVLAVEREY